jgi:hypothetical protein
MPSDAPSWSDDRRPDDRRPDDRRPDDRRPGGRRPDDPPSPEVSGDAAPAVLTITEPRDLVALVPYRLGYRPLDSLVLLCLRGGRPRVGLVMRVDLPDPAELPVVVAALARHAVDDGAAAAVAVVYRHSPVEASTVPSITGSLADAGVELREAWQVGEHRLWSLTCHDRSCCPSDGWSVEVLEGAQVSAEMVALGRGVAPSRQALAGDLRPVDAARRSVVADLVARRPAGRPAVDGGLVPWRRTALATWRAVVCDQESSGEVPESAAAVLLAALADPVLRDAVLLDCVPQSQAAADELVCSGASRTAQALERVFSAQSAVAPDQVRQQRAETVLRSIVRQGTGAWRAGPLGLLAWSAWWAGDGGRSSVLAELALDADPQHRLARLLSAALEAGLAPGWAKRDRLARAR